MRWLRASQFSHVSASSSRGGSGRSATPRECAPENGGCNDFAGWDRFRGLPETGSGLRADDGRDPVSDAGSSFALTDLRLAELRSVSEIPGAAGFPVFLAGEARGAP